MRRWCGCRYPSFACAFASVALKRMIVSSPCASLNGARRSPHTNEAADIHIKGMTNLDPARRAEESGLFNGLGYDEESAKTRHGPHMHVDIKDRQALWWEDKAGRTRPYLPPQQENQ